MNKYSVKKCINKLYGLAVFLKSCQLISQTMECIYWQWELVKINERKKIQRLIRYKV